MGTQQHLITALIVSLAVMTAVTLWSNLHLAGKIDDLDQRLTEVEDRPD